MTRNRTEYHKQYRSQRKEAGLCCRCGNPKEDSVHTYCSACRDEYTRLAKERYQKLKEQGLCVECGKAKAQSGLLCPSCKDVQKNSATKRYTERKVNKACFNCGSERILQSTLGKKRQFCEDCYFKDKAKEHFQQAELGKALRDIFHRQEGKCAYSGIELLLGVNDSIDHIKPMAIYPNLAKDIANICWADKRVNEMKRDMSADDFLDLVKCIYRNTEEVNGTQ